jgi:translation initiation factor IF-1
MSADEGVALEAVTATVLELLPNAAYRLELEDRRQVRAHAAGAGKLNFVRVRPGDRVQVELSPHDPTRGRITKLLERS